MARSPPPLPQPANLSAQQMREAIPKIDRRIADLDAFNVESVASRDDPSIQSLEQKLNTTLQGIFGHNSIEYHTHHGSMLPLDMAPYNYLNPTPLHLVHDGLKNGVARARATLQTIKEGFLEELQDSTAGTPANRVLAAYAGLELHGEIERVAGKLFRDGHYSNAIEDAVKALNAFVRLRSGVGDRDGVSLMEFVFNPSNPILKFNGLSDQSDRDEQRGFMLMFSGAVAGLRNPRAHTIMKDDPERALEFIAFISLLAKLTDEARK